MATVVDTVTDTAVVTLVTAVLAMRTDRPVAVVTVAFTMRTDVALADAEAAEVSLSLSAHQVLDSV